jgi:uncharacterized DUF497 family protein
MKFDGFEWDEGNSNKSRRKHGVSISDCEQVFYNTPIVFLDDLRHSITEERRIALGRTDSQKLLFVAFTVRNNRIRVISARTANRKERAFYEESI